MQLGQTLEEQCSVQKGEQSRNCTLIMEVCSVLNNTTTLSQMYFRAI